ncbi:MAG: histidine triad nucleotide-binding protein [Pseudomonadota bacterium]|nr:histidine triad nucleotide-binding protein [Pseudomonadota bacterium]
MAESCIFCRIVKGEIPSKKVYEDEWVLGLEDLNPAAPVHYLFLPKKHVRSLNELNLHQDSQDGEQLIARIFSAISKVTNKENISDPGYKVAINTGVKGGQSVFHLHVHLLAGKDFSSHFSHV